MEPDEKESEEPVTEPAPEPDSEPGVTPRTIRHIGEPGPIVPVPPTVPGGKPVSALVTLTSPAPLGGVTLALQYFSGDIVGSDPERIANAFSIAALPLNAPPASVTIPSGQLSAAITLHTTAVQVATTVTIKASANGHVGAGSITVLHH